MNAKDRFYNHKMGVFNHFLSVLQNNPITPHSYGRHTDWDTLVREFDVSLVARQLHEIGAGYYVLTVMQGEKYMIAPNAAFDRIAGTSPAEACATRDLIWDLIRELEPYGIDLFLYFTGDGPYKSHPEGDRFGFVEPRERGVTRPFVERWAEVLREYSTRYGTHVKGWWIDGCYRDYFRYTDDLLSLYYDACKAGNPDALVALNGGVSASLQANACFEDFTCGECTDFMTLPSSRFIGKAQAHILAPLGTVPEGMPRDLVEDMIGPGWGQFGAKRDGDYLADYVARVHEAGGVVTFDIGVYRDGKFDPTQMEILRYIRKKNPSLNSVKNSPKNSL